jgi:hypothetical protein
MEEHIAWMPRFRNYKHWTLQYVKDRIVRMAHEMLHPDWPWLPPAAVKYLRKQLWHDATGLEFGSGRSTVWLARRVAMLLTTEHSPYWIDKTKKALIRAGVINKVGIFKVSELQDYLNVVKQLHNEYLNFCLVDSGPRDHCIMAVLPKLKCGGMLILDNAERYLPSDSRTPEALHGYASPYGKNLPRQ